MEAASNYTLGVASPPPGTMEDADYGLMLPEGEPRFLDSFFNTTNSTNITDNPILFYGGLAVVGFVLFGKAK
jgi:hypothetical protein